MKLVINLSMLGDKPTGLGVYSLVCARIGRTFKALVIGKAPADVSVEGSVASPVSIGIGGGKLAAIKRQLWMRKLDFDSSSFLVYSPTHHGLPSQKGQVITIHDLICLRFPRQHIVQYLFFKYVAPRLLRKCAAVFTVSETSRRDIVATYRVDPSRVHVVPNAVDAERFVPGEVETHVPYLLMVGARYTHKNVDDVLRMAASWKDRYRLVVTSCAGKYRADLEKIIEAMGLRSHVEFRDYVSADDLLRLYQGCSALVYASKWEGFGIPPLEALACGRPVIASDIEVHREVLEGAALFFQLGNEGSFGDAIDALNDYGRINELLAGGRLRVAHYSQPNALAALKRSLLAVAPNLELV